MTVFEPRISVVGSDCSTNWATTTALTQFISFSSEEKLPKKGKRRINEVWYCADKGSTEICEKNPAATAVPVVVAVVKVVVVGIVDVSAAVVAVAVTVAEAEAG